MRFALQRALCTHVVELRIAVREVPCAAEFTPVDPQYRTASQTTLLVRLERGDLVFVHDLLRWLAALRSEIMHASILITLGVYVSGYGWTPVGWLPSGVLKCDAAVCYSPTPCRVQYHCRARA